MLGIELGSFGRTASVLSHPTISPVPGFAFLKDFFLLFYLCVCICFCVSECHMCLGEEVLEAGATGSGKPIHTGARGWGLDLGPLGEQQALTVEPPVQPQV